MQRQITNGNPIAVSWKIFFKEPEILNMTVINASLTFKKGNDFQHIILLPGNQATFGRDNSNDIKLALFPLDDVVLQWATADISRQHFVIVRKDDGYAIRDLESTNGTSINCIALLTKEEYLRDHSVVDVGGVLDLKVNLLADWLWLHRITNTPEESYLLFREKVELGDLCGLHTPANCNCHHRAQIRYDGRRYWLEKAGNDNSSVVLLNDSKLKAGNPLDLKAEDHITLGDLSILFKHHEN